MNNQNDIVNHPAHYTREGAMETIDEMILLFGIDDTMAFCKLNAWKYRSRALMKNGVEDLKKSDWYLKKYEELVKMNEERYRSRRDYARYYTPYNGPSIVPTINKLADDD